MKIKVLLFVLACISFYFLKAQVPNKISYQGVVRNTNGTVVSSTGVGVRISILQGSSTGTAVYVETQLVQTNAYGLFKLNIGDGVVSSGNLSTIDWSTGIYFLKSDIDPAGGSSYVFSSTTQLLSVPYALYAKAAGNGDVPITLKDGGIVTVSGVYPNFTITGASAGGTTYTAGTGIVITGANGIVNTAPHIPVSLTGTGSVTITGSNNNFTVNSQNLVAGSNITISGNTISAANPTSTPFTSIVGNNISINQVGQAFTLTGLAGTPTSIVGNNLGVNQNGAAFTLSGVNTSISGNNGLMVMQSGQAFTLDGANFVRTVVGINGITINQSGSNYSVSGGGSLSGIGQTNGLAYYTGANTLTSNGSNLSWNGSTLSINGVRFFTTTTGSNSNIALGNGAGNLASTGLDNNFIGSQSGRINNTGNSNNFIGVYTGYSNTSGSYNNFIGYYAGANSTGNNNNFLGWGSGNGNTTGSDNNFIGTNAGLANTTGSRNIAIGYNSNMATNNINNAVAIGAFATVGGDNMIALGGTGVNVVNVGIGTGLPTATLDVVGNARIRNLSVAGTVISDALGNLSVSSVVGSSSQWITTTNGIYIKSFVGFGQGNPTAMIDAFSTTVTAIKAQSSGNTTQTYAISAVQSGTGDVAGFFSAINPASSLHGIFTEARGSGAGIYAGNFGTGRAGVFQNFNTSNASPVMEVFTNSTGPGLAMNADIRMNDNDIKFRAVPDKSHGIGYKFTFGGATIDGPVMFGYSGGALGTVDVSGTLQNLAMMWNSSGSIGIGTTLPGAKLDITGNIKIKDGTQGVGKVLTSDANGLATWQTISASILTINGSNVQPIGYYAFNLASTTGVYKINGVNALKADSKANILVGDAGNAAISGANNIYIGSSTGTNTTSASDNIFIGLLTAKSFNTGSQNVLIGSEIGQFGTTATRNAIIGFRAGYQLRTGADNVFIGNLAGSDNQGGNNNVFSGSYAGNLNNTGNNNVAVGYLAAQQGVSASSNVMLGAWAGRSNTANNNVFVGFESGELNTTGANNSFFGYQTGNANTTGFENVFMGVGAGIANTTGSDNVYIGPYTGNSNTTALGNVFIGYSTGQSTTGVDNVFIGSQTGGASKGSNNILLGYRTGFNNTGDGNIFQGYQAGLANTIGTNNIVIGTNANVGLNNLSNAVAIGTNAVVSSNNAIALGGTGANAVNVGIGTSSPNAPLHINAGLDLRKIILYEQADNINQYIGFGVGGFGTFESQIPINSNAFVWKVGTSATTSNEVMRIKGTGEVGIGTTAPGSLLHLANGVLQLESSLNTAGSASILFNKSRAGATVQSGDELGYISFRGSDGTLSRRAGYIIAQADAAPSGGIVPGRIMFFTSGGGSADNERMRITSDGNVGIGTGNPNGFSGKIVHLSGTGNTAYILEKTDATARKWGMVTGLGGEYIIQDMSGGNNSITIQPGATTNQLYLRAGGNVGIGTNAPSYPLDVAGTTKYGNFTTTFFNSGNGGGLSVGELRDPDISVRAAGAFVSVGAGFSGGFYVTSDERIKRKVGLSNSSNDLSTLMKLKIIDYKYTDSLNTGNIQVKGVFAQEVEKIYPQAISKQTNWIPTIYSVAEKLAFDEANQTLKITMNKSHGLVVGDKVKLISNTSGEKPATVVSANGNSFTVNNWTEKSEKIFVYGKEVNDFRIVDYDRIFILGISAIQELSKNLEAEKAKNLQLELQMQKMEAESKGIKAEIELIKNHLQLEVKGQK